MAVTGILLALGSPTDATPGLLDALDEPEPEHAG